MAAFESSARVVGVGAYSLEGLAADVELPRGVGGAPLAEMPWVELGRDGVTHTLVIHSVRRAGHVRDDLDSLARNWEMTRGAQYPRTLAIFADRRSHVGDLRALLDATPDHAHVLVFLDTSPAPPVPPCPAQLGALCEQVTDRHERPHAVSRGWVRTAGSCDSLIAALREVVSVELSGKRDFLANRVPRALRACDCGDGIDLDAFEYLTLVGLGGLDPRLRSIPFPPPPPTDQVLTVEAWLAARTP